MTKFKLNNTIQTRLNTHNNMQKVVSHLSLFLWDNKILSQNKIWDWSVNEMNECGLIFFCSFPDKIL